jgi:hypothetical protein
MILVDPGPEPCVGRRCSVHALRRCPARTREDWHPVRNEGAQQAGLPASEGLRHFSGRYIKVAKKDGVHNVHTLGFGSCRTGAGLARIAEDFGGAAEIQGLEPGSSPTSGTVFSLFRGFLGFFRVRIVHTFASDLMFRVCGVPETAYSVVGEWPATADRVPPGGASAGSSSLFVLPWVFGVHYFMVARVAYNMTC